MKRLGIIVLLFSAGLLQSAFPQSRSLVTSAGWVEQTSPTTKTLWDIHAFSADVAWGIVWSGGPVIRTTNGGTLWSTTTTTPFPNALLLDLEVLDAQKALVAVGTNAFDTTWIVRTTNAGATWDTVVGQLGGFLNGICMFDQNNGMAIGKGVPQPTTDFSAFRTTNGGVSWAPLLNPPAASSVNVTPWSLTSAGSSHIWFVANDTRIHRTTDGGTGWDEVRPYPSTSIVSIAFTDQNHGVLTTFGGFSAWSSDGGTTWTQVDLPDPGGAGGVVGKGVDFFVSKNDKIYRSTDRGHSWSLSYAGGVGEITAITVYSQGTNLICWAGSASGSILRYDGTVTDVEKPSTEIPGAFTLQQNFPNPFNPSTNIRYGLPQRSHVSLLVYNTLGQQVASLVSGEVDAGSHEVTFDASMLPSGVYLYRLQAGSYAESKKLLLVK